MATGVYRRPNRIRPRTRWVGTKQVAPVNLIAPTISGADTAGSVLTAATGSWLSRPTSYAYQWTLDGSNIGGETAPTYTSLVGDVGHAVGVKVTATNSTGSSSATASSNTITVTAAGGADVTAAVAAPRAATRALLDLID